LSLADRRSAIWFFERKFIMALIKLGAGVLAISGSIGGTTFARNRSGSYIRQRTKPVNPNSPRQLAARNNIQALTQSWNSVLTIAQRQAWGLYADSVNVLNRLGETISLSGYNMFIRSNAILLGAGQDGVSDAPTIFELATSDPSFAVAISEATQVASVTFDNALDWANEDDAYMIIYQGQPRQNTRNFFNGNKRILGVIEGDSATPPTSPATQTCDWAVTEDQLVAMYGRIVRADGRASEPFRIDSTVVA
jgi:hypothetical protein